MNRLPRSFFERDTVIVARELIGSVLMRKIGDQLLSGIIIETEAYGYDNDPASHAYGGKRKRNVPLFGPSGHAYVYFTYGNHYCMNVVAKNSAVQAGGVLIRAIEPIQGIALMKLHRNKDDMRILANGPGKLAQALQLTTAHNGIDCTDSDELWIVKGKQLPVHITPRIGISKAQEKLWRFIL